MNGVRMRWTTLFSISLSAATLAALPSCAAPVAKLSQTPQTPQGPLSPSPAGHAGCGEDSPAPLAPAAVSPLAPGPLALSGPTNAAGNGDASSPSSPAETLPPALLVRGDASPAPAVVPSVRIALPSSGQTWAADGAVTLTVTNWPTMEGGAHVHLILDNQPYKPIYNTGAPVNLRDLNGGKELSAGPHVVVAFASRANHESVKEAGALSVAAFSVGPTSSPAESPPFFLVYSRPKGTYAGAQANHILVDFQLVNIVLGEKTASVSIEVRGSKLSVPLRASTAQFGRPYYVENLPSGTYEMELNLLDHAGRPVPGAWNKTVRTIVVDRSVGPAIKP